MTYTGRRREVNEASKQVAENDTQPWETFELELLREGWKVTPLEEIAVTLGRTVEACRQRFYEDQKREVRQAAKPQQTTAQKAWLKGYTSLEDMGY